MVNWIIEEFGLVYREAWALTKAVEYLKGILENFSILFPKTGQKSAQK